MTTNKQRLLSDPVTSLNGVGASLKEKLARIGINRIQDVLFHLPYRYIDRTRITPIGALLPGREAYIQGEIELTQVRYGKRRSLLCRISDGTGAVILRFFYFSKSQEKGLQKGLSLRCYGQVRRGPNSLEMIHPEYRRVNLDEEESLDEVLTPVYPSTEGLQQTRLRKLSEQTLTVLNNDKETLNELLPDSILNSYQLPTLSDALNYVHRPPPDADVQRLIEKNHPAQHRLAFEELLAHQLYLLELRNELRKEQSHSFKNSEHLVPEFLKDLPFKLTRAQEKAFATIETDLNKTVSMLRLLQGDVGSGKTIVAALATLQVIENQYQVAMMAPTELLAEQHFKNFKQWFEPLGIEVLFLSGKLKKSDKTKVALQLEEEKPFIVIGTHALFQKAINIRKLGLVIIDEQHRFGVHQRLALLEKGREHKEYPHQLIMTATPIPRTLTMTAYADLDHTIIDELPPNRKTISTSVLSNERRDEIIERINKVCNKGRQVYWVCTLIEESETLQCETAINTTETLREKLDNINIGLIHGRMKADEKEAIMTAFKNGDINLLVATTVIEVGVDVPNASLMVIDNAERLGLSQLHQLRGRIGRGNIKSDCVLMYQHPLGELAKKRLETMRTSTDGFSIAEKDLELRGPGEVLGTKQAGMPDMQIADLLRDAHLLPDIQKLAKKILKQHPQIVKKIINRWLGYRLDFTNV